MTIKSYLFSFFLSLVLIGCGGGSGGSQNNGFTGNTSRATVDDDNAEAVSRSTIEAANRAPAYQSSSVVGSLKSSSNADLNGIYLSIKGAVEDAAEAQLGDGQARVEVPINCSVSGSATVIFPNLNQNTTTIPSSGIATTIYNNCNEFGDILDGVADFTWSGGFDPNLGFANFTMTLDLTVTLDGQASQTVNGTITCTNYGSTCTSTEDFVGADGADIRVENVDVSGNGTTGYNVNARVYHENYGYVDIVATGITFCSNGNIQSGTIRVTDSTSAEVLLVTFSNCDEFTVTFDDVATVYDQ